MKKYFFVFFYIGLGVAMASTSSQGLPWEDGLTTLKNSITGPVASVISLMAIVASGVGLVFGGEFSGFVKTLLYIVLVVSVIVGAANILALVNSSGMMI
ncbi:TrbC/VirB2 family protein [Sulfurospirillum cavolei]|uniref:TrbC/VirB2 family protein n=1 Tax=Sulfurospirillum cavolei TaxID=366522 RepID=UPI003FA2237F